MQVQDDARAGLAGGGQRAPAERGVHVVGVDDAGAAAPHRLPDRVRLEAAAQQPGRGARRAQRERVAHEDLGLLAELVAHQPGEVLDRALLPAGRAVAVVQEQDQRSARRSSRPPTTVTVRWTGRISHGARTCLAAKRSTEAARCASRAAVTPPAWLTRTDGR